MENRINQIITLEDGKKIVIMNQAIYQNKSYYLASEITQDEENITGEYYILEEKVENGDHYLNLVTDKKILEVVVKYLQVEE